jgi:riboflavin-specific deaminase-like protein
VPSRPFVTVSYAQSVDGKIATSSGLSQWISGPRSLKLAHRLRRDNDAIAVGIGTVLRDNPELTCRLRRCVSPIRVVFDSNLRVPLDCKIIATAAQTPSIVFAKNPVPKEKARQLEERGAEVRGLPADAQGRVPVNKALESLSESGIKRLFVEGGGGLITSFLRAGLVNRMIIVTAPLIIGQGIAAVGDLGVVDLKDALRPKRFRRKKMGADLVWELDL